MNNLSKPALTKNVKREGKDKHNKEFNDFLILISIKVACRRLLLRRRLDKDRQSNVMKTHAERYVPYYNRRWNVRQRCLDTN
jgi:hypothetical protein